MQEIKQHLTVRNVTFKSCKFSFAVDWNWFALKSAIGNRILDQYIYNLDKKNFCVLICVIEFLIPKLYRLFLSIAAKK